MIDGGLPVHVERLGLEPGPDVETFLMVHGYGASAFTWRRWAPRLAERGHVVLVDMKGFGAAPKPDDGRYAPEDLADGVFQVARLLAPDRLTLVGHSLGGGVTLLTALRMRDDGPGLPARLVIVAGAAFRQRLPPFVRLAEHPRLSALVFRVLGPRRITRSVLRSIVHDPRTVTVDQVGGYARPLKAPGAVGALVSAARRIVPDDLDALTRRYPELDVPALLLWGRNDRVVPLWVGEKLHAALPRSRLRVLDGCGHLPAEERPDESFEVLRTFLDET